jgi:hypothetical protein
MSTIRKGARMIEAADFVTRNPGVTKMAVAKDIGPNQSLRFGYSIVGRAIAAGMIQARRSGNGSYQLFPADWDMNEVCF